MSRIVHLLFVSTLCCSTPPSDVLLPLPEAVSLSHLDNIWFIPPSPMLNELFLSVI
jgi:hypothetical protein